MRKPGKDADLATQKAYWYQKLKAEGFRDCEDYQDSNIVFSHSVGAPQFTKDTQSNQSPQDALDSGLASGSLVHHEPRMPYWEMDRLYYDKAQCLASNWPYRRWSRGELGQLESYIWKLHSEGMAYIEIFKRLKAEKRLIKGTIGSTKSVQRCINKYQAVLALIDFDKILSWPPGEAVEQLFKLDKALLTKVEELLAKRQV